MKKKPDEEALRVKAFLLVFLIANDYLNLSGGRDAV